ncbi:hypothetical protein F2Q69_00042138 [Brassica cretica]|uniref:Uncharacterized protein n=1 Tax=Brassica cretica TaxID=69181 RepID=A0A8S9NSG1_BRACR|nr:hypothetical protein F2Q69_00042138 [Brassica cretica]
MVSQIVWLGAKDVFTQIAKDVVGQGLDHGRRSLRSLIQNQCGVSCGTIACSDVTEGNETQKPVKVAWSYGVLPKFISLRSSRRTFFIGFFERILMTHSFLERIGQPEVDLANDPEESVPFNVLDAFS